MGTQPNLKKMFSGREKFTQKADEAAAGGAQFFCEKLFKKEFELNLREIAFSNLHAMTFSLFDKFP